MTQTAPIILLSYLRKWRFKKTVILTFLFINIILYINKIIIYSSVKWYTPLTIVLKKKITLYVFVMAKHLRNVCLEGN